MISIRTRKGIENGLDAYLLIAYRARRQRDLFAYYLTTATDAVREIRGTARASAENVFNWRETNAYGPNETTHRFHYTRAGFEYVAEIITDDYSADTSHYGKFEERRDGYDSRPSPDAVALEYRDFHSGGRCPVWYLPDVSYQEQREAYSGCGKAAADALARNSIRGSHSGLAALKAIYEESVSFVGVKVTCYGAGVQLASDALWGIEFDGRDFSYINSTAGDLEYQATREAGEKLDAVISETGERLARLRELKNSVRADAVLADAGAPHLVQPSRVEIETKERIKRRA